MILSGVATLPGALLGVGIDIVRLGRVRPLVSERIYTAREREIFTGELELPFAGREAVLKAVGVASILGLPLIQMPLDRTEKGLSFAPGPRFLEIMRSRGVVGVTLTQHPLDASHCAMTAMAWGPRSEANFPENDAHLESKAVRWSCVLMRLIDAEITALSEAERAFVATRKKPAESIATRHAARIAIAALNRGDPRDISEVRRGGSETLPYGSERYLPYGSEQCLPYGSERNLGVMGEIEIVGGGDIAPSIRGIEGAFLSLTHETDVAAALVAITGGAEHESG